MKKNTRLIVLGIIGLAIVGGFIWTLAPKEAAAPSEEIATSTATSTTETKGVTKTGTKPVATSPEIPLSDLIQKSGGQVSLYAGVDPSGRKIYNPVPGADAATFKALSAPVVVEYPTEQRGFTVTELGKGSVAYYKDKNRIYVLSLFEKTGQTKVAIQVVDNADLPTFTITKSPWYAKDKTQVYRLSAPTSVGPYAPGAYSWEPYDLAGIANAEPASFVVVASGNSDAHDNRFYYRKGIVLGTYP